jgi:hypothetical protein
VDDERGGCEPVSDQFPVGCGDGDDVAEEFGVSGDPDEPAEGWEDGVEARLTSLENLVKSSLFAVLLAVVAAVACVVVVAAWR